MVTRARILTTLTALLAATVARTAHADAPPPPPPPPPAAAAPAPAAAPAADSAQKPKVHHAPIAVAKPHEALDITVDIVAPHLVKRATVVYRELPSGPVRELALLRAGEGYVARIPEEHVNPPGLEYTIELETTDGARHSVFATRKEMHSVQVGDDLDDVRERQMLARLDGRRSVFVGSFDYVYYGRTIADTGPPGSPAPQQVRDHYWRAEVAYYYRPLKYVVEFGIRLGAVRGLSPSGGAGKGTDVGLNYGAPTALFRLDDLVHAEVSLLTSVTEVGFSTGVGGALHIGDPFGSKLVLAFDTTKTFGSRGWARLDIARGRLRVSPVVEVGDIPNARLGVRLFTELTYLFSNGFSLAARGGYAARDFNRGGPGGGLAVGYAF